MTGPQRIALALVFVASIFGSDTTHAQGPGFPNVARTKGELLAGPVSPTIGRTAVVIYHQGLLIANPEAPESAAGSDLLSRSYDISDPRNPVATVIPEMGANSMVGAHGYWHEGAHLRGLRGSGGRSFTVTGSGSAARVVESSSLPSIFTPRKTGVTIPWAGRGLMFQPFQTQYYRSYGTTEHVNVLFKGSQELAIWDHIGLTGVVGHPFLIGNILYVASDQAMSGIAAYDITPSLNAPGTPPQLIGLLNAPIGGYWPEIWGGNGKLLVVFPARAARFMVADVTDPTNMFVVADRTLPNGDPSYAQFQDNFVFMDRYKIDMTNDFAIDLALDNRTRGIDPSQFALPIGNLLVTGGLQRNGSTPMTQGLAIWAHQAAPDTTGPSVGFHIPRANQTSYPVGAPITLLIHETLRTETIENGSTFLVRPLSPSGAPGAAIAGQIVFAFDDVLTFTPSQPLAPNTTYEVSLPANGIRDAANNGMVPYSFRFSTGATLGGGNEPPAILAFGSSQHPAPVGGTITLSFGANDPEGSPVSYRVDFGDGSATQWITSGSVTHSFAAAGHYGVVLQARDASGATSTQQLTVTVMNAPTGPRPTQSAPISFDAANSRTWSVNPDNDSVTRIASNGAVVEIGLGLGTRPRSVATDASGNAWVTCEGTDEVVIVSPAGALIDAIEFAYGSAPYGIAFTPDKSSALVTTHGKGELWRFSGSTRQATGSIVLGPTARAIAITGNGARALVTRFVSPDAGAQVWDVALGAGLGLTRTITLAEDRTTADTPSRGRGLPNYLASIAITPSGARAWVASKQDNHRRGVFASGTDLTTDGTVRAIVSEIDLASGTEVPAARRDVDNSDSPSGVTFSPLGDWAFVTLQGNNMVAVYDALIDAAAVGGDVPVVSRFGTGRAPQGAALDATGQRLHVHDFLSRGVTRLELASFLTGTSASVTSSFVSTITGEALPADVVAGKRIFYNASDDGGPDGSNRMSAEGYISCATCHVDGGHDGRTWDFTGRGEGLRNTTDLRGRAGVGHGRVHWSANFDEIQDFENDIRGPFGGVGFLSDGQFALTSNTLGTPKAGRSADLDALAAYVTSLGAKHLPRTPFRDADGTKSEAGLRGAQVFQTYGCPSCHVGGKKTDSALAMSLLHDVGTLSSTSGQRLGGPLAGIDTPTLLGLAYSAPYLHDGSAATLEDVFTSVGGSVLQAEDAVLTGASVITPTQGGNLHGGEAVRFLAASNRIRFDGVDGGSGGSARVTLRYASLANGAQITVRVNGAVAGTLSMPATPNVPNWFPNAFTTRTIDVTLASGAGNTIQLEPNNDRVAIDDVIVVNASDTASASIHGVVSTLAASARGDLMQYLRELDGADAVALPEVGDTLGAGAAMLGIALLRRLRGERRRD
ncbi:MAG: Ig-like domain-containing protein [Myxococcota bacterium]|nr:Ig-like domain-containing protein [Myxococcota bacterium]